MILLVTSDEQRANAILEDLSVEGFEIQGISDFKKALFRLYNRPEFEMILLDLESYTEEALDFCKKIKKDFTLKFIPLICIVNRDQIIDQLLLFELGADDFIFTPYSTVELQLKMRTIKRLMNLQKALKQKETQVENLKNIQRIMVTLNHYINNALTPLHTLVQLMDEKKHSDPQRLKDTSRRTVEMISRILTTLRQLVDTGEMKIVQQGVYKDLLLDIEKELKDIHG